MLQKRKFTHFLIIFDKYPIFINKCHRGPYYLFCTTILALYSYKNIGFVSSLIHSIQYSCAVDSILMCSDYCHS